MKQILKNFTKQANIAPLITFRVIFGALMLFSTVRFITLGWVNDHFIATTFHFKYFGFHWVEALPPSGMYAVHILMILTSILVILGWYYRVSISLLFLSFTYTELIDITYYLNHYYFVSIILFLMIFLPANRYFSLDVYFGRVQKKPQIPAWIIGVIKLQLALVYFYAGVAKINHDWLIEALPLKIWLPAKDNIPILGWLFTLPISPWLFSWFGMLYDCTIWIWMLWDRSRPLAYFTVIVFHALTGILFQIGIFPMVMIAVTTIFFDSKYHENVIRHLSRLIGKLNVKKRTIEASFQTFQLPRILKIFLAVFFVFQVLFPWRYLLYPGNIFWTEEGYRFAWRVMLMEKAGTATFFVKGKNQIKAGVVDNREFLNAHQEKQMAIQPDLILQYAHFLQSYYQKAGIEDPEVKAEVYVTLNAKPSKLLIDPNVDLTLIEDGWKHKSWILPYYD